jgi:hypothetical protein
LAQKLSQLFAAGLFAIFVPSQKWKDGPGSAAANLIHHLMEQQGYAHSTLRRFA